MIKNLNTSLFEQGKIKIGGKGKKKLSSGAYEALKLDYFVLTTLEHDGTPEKNFKIDEEAMQGLPEKPTELPVEFLYDDIDLNFPTCFAMYGKDGYICKGDGETADREGKEIPCDPNTCKFSLRKKCKISGILLCRLPHLSNLMGVYKFRTHSWNSVKNILASLQYIQTLTGGIVAGLPFALRLEKKPTKHGVVKIVNLVFPGDENALADELEKVVSRRQRLQFDINRIEQAARVSGIAQDTDDPEDVVAEYFPGNNDREEPTQAEIDALLEKAYIAIEGLWARYERTVFETSASVKKNLHLDSGDLRECRDIERLRDYYTTHRKQYEDEYQKWLKKHSDVDSELDDTTQQDYDLVKSVLGVQQAAALKKALIDNDDDAYTAILQEAHKGGANE